MILVLRESFQADVFEEGIAANPSSATKLGGSSIGCI